MSIIDKNSGTAVALGNFDGMHLGHIAVLNETKKFSSNGFIPCVVLFDLHPQQAVTGNTPPMLMTKADKIKFITDSGFSYVELKFMEIRELSPEDFVSNVLIGLLNAKAVVCGYNYRFGKNAAGDAPMMKSLCENHGIECRVVEEVENGKTAVSSTRIRHLIENGEIEEANLMLGKEFGFTSEVIHGDRRGRTWGFPTINQLLPSGLVMPKFGVYASEVTVKNKVYTGVTNIGKRPTIGTDLILSETNIIDFTDEIYGEDIEIRLKKFIRAENKFSSFDELASQIKSDVMKVKRGE